MNNKPLHNIVQSIARMVNRNTVIRTLITLTYHFDLESFLPQLVLDLYPNYTNNYYCPFTIESTLRDLAEKHGEEISRVRDDYTLADIVYERVVDVGVTFALQDYPEQLLKDHTHILLAFCILAFDHFSRVEQCVILHEYLECNPLRLPLDLPFHLTRQERTTVGEILRRAGIVISLKDIPQTYLLTSLERYMPTRIINQKDEMVESILKRKDSAEDKTEFLFQQMHNLGEGQIVHLLILLSDSEYNDLKQRMKDDRAEQLATIEKTDWLPTGLWVQAHSALKYGNIPYLHDAEKRREALKSEGTYPATDDSEFDLAAELEMKRMKTEGKTTQAIN